MDETDHDPRCPGQLMSSPATVKTDRFTFDPTTHVYQVDGVRVPSVSEILRSAGLVDYAGIPQDVLEYAASRGTAVHLATCFYDQGDLDRDSLDEQVAPYVTAWMKFREEHPFQILETEQMHLGILGGLRFGMTVDRLITLSVPVSNRTILDIKCTREIHRHHGVQLAGYEVGIKSNLAPGDRSEWRRAVVQLKPDCTYKFHEFSDVRDREVFAAALEICHWKMAARI